MIIPEKTLQFETIGSSYLTNPTNGGVPLATATESQKSIATSKLRVSYE